MDADKLARIQKNFYKLMSELGDCWVLSEQNRSYGSDLTRLLNKYHKISWFDECTMSMDEDYFLAHYDATRVRGDHKYTQSLHVLLVELVGRDRFGRQMLWNEFLFGMSTKDMEEIVDRYNLYRKEYDELLEDARLKWEESTMKNGGSATVASETRAT